MQKLVAEFIGVFALCLVGGGSIIASKAMGADGGGIVAIALAHGIILSIAVSAAMNISGGHINPAVTCAMLVTRRISVGGAFGYIAAQVLGGILGGYMLGAVFFDRVSAPDGSDPVIETLCGSPTYSVEKLSLKAAQSRVVEVPADDAPAAEGEEGGRPGSESAPATRNVTRVFTPARPTADMEWSAAQRAAVIEGALTFLLVFAVFGTAVDPRHPNIGGFGIGLTVTACILVGEPLTGAGLNPARVIGTAMLAGSDYWQYGWLPYIVGPIAGGIFAGIVYQTLILRNEPAKS